MAGGVGFKSLHASNTTSQHEQFTRNINITSTTNQKLHLTEKHRDQSHIEFDNLVNIQDPQFRHMWYLNRGMKLDMSVQKVWKMGITGKGIVVTILDDGIEMNNPDLTDNYDPEASWDVNQNDDDPTPRYDMSDSNR